MFLYFFINFDEFVLYVIFFLYFFFCGIVKFLVNCLKKCVVLEGILLSLYIEKSKMNRYLLFGL